ncbi:MAG: hypothetical protein PHR06_01150 [Candidatus Cloacimonetes bacterium]|nr:hypothetical protein [Candidatus Cloacimonadota bacterium]
MSNEIKQIEKYIDETAKKVAAEFKRQGLMRDNKQSPFQKTETLLYNYNNFQQAIDDKYKQIETIQCEGVSKKSHSITSFNSSDGMRDNKLDSEKAEEKIESIEQSIAVTKNLISIIDDAIEKLKNDPYYEVIRLKYFEGITREKLAEYFEVDVSTISRNKNRLINTLQIRLFSDEVVFQIFS